jgi:hypothetical protein
MDESDEEEEDELSIEEIARQGKTVPEKVLDLKEDEVWLAVMTEPRCFCCVVITGRGVPQVPRFFRHCMKLLYLCI